MGGDVNLQEYYYQDLWSCVIFLLFGIDRLKQTVKTKIRLILHRVPYHLHLLEALFNSMFMNLCVLHFKFLELIFFI